jgi:hypothetical protein
MELEENQIASKELVGWDGADPVYALETKGGRAYVVEMRNGRLEECGIGPHMAVAKYIAKKLRKGIVWTGLAKADERIDPGSRLVAKYEQVTRLVRAAKGL